MQLEPTTTATTADAVTAPKKTEKGNALRWVINPSIAAQSLATFEGGVYQRWWGKAPNGNAEIYPFGVIQQNGKYGIIGLDGKISAEPIYVEARACACTKKFLLTKEGGAMFAVNDDLTLSKHDGGGSDYSYIYDGEKIVEAAGETDYFYADANVEYCVLQKGKLDPAWNEEGIDLKYTLEKPFAIAHNGKMVTPFQYTAHGKFSQELVALQNAQGKWGYYNSQGKLVVPLIYEGATNVVNDHCFVKENGKWGVAALAQQKRNSRPIGRLNLSVSALSYLPGRLPSEYCRH